MRCQVKFIDPFHDVREEFGAGQIASESSSSAVRIWRISSRGDPQFQGINISGLACRNVSWNF
jgi:hypothetical protein